MVINRSWCADGTSETQITLHKPLNNLQIEAIRAIADSQSVIYKANIKGGEIKVTERAVIVYNTIEDARFYSVLDVTKNNGG